MRVSEERSRATSFEELAMPLFDQLYNFAHWLTRDQAEAEDLVQETYTKALRGFSSFQPGTNFRAWMYRILRNSFLNSRTGLKTMVALDDEGEEELPAEQVTPEVLLIERANREMVQQAVEELPVPFREILLLCEVEEMSYQEISGALGIAAGTVMSRLFRARKALRAAIQLRMEGGRHGL
jgi:RNA polymerase sigma-70 factor (ECF subfamily)